nr:unnamed protein product [Callosobruchus analis]
MYRLNLEWCENINLPVAKDSSYRNIFLNNFNLGFHRPKKDQCRICVAFTKKDVKTEEYEQHIKKKDIARNEKRKDKQQAGESEGTIVSINFDLQQVLVTPSDPTNNQLFYKTRLSTYNFTVYNVVSKEGTCYMWHESEGGRGSCEIASCLFQYFQSLADNAKEVRCFSDRCGGQNLNQFVVGMCIYAMNTLQLESIDLKFLTCGHSEMECDSMHSAISTAFKRVGKAYWPGDWKTIARGARKKGDKPYTVVDNLQFNDWKSFVNTNLNIRKRDIAGQPVLWQKISWIRLEASLPNFFKFKESFDDEDFRVVDCSTNTRQSSHQPLLTLYKNRDVSLKQSMIV